MIAEEYREKGKSLPTDTTEIGNAQRSPARDFQPVCRKLGFIFKRTTGSHERWAHPDGRAVTIAIHGGAQSDHLSFKILRQLVISLEEFERYR